jgi:hypothetical protein
MNATDIGHSDASQNYEIRGSQIGKPLLIILASREVNISFQRLLWNDLN